MAKPVDNDELEQLLNKLLPVLTKAIEGDFSSRIEMKPDDRFNEIYAGVQTLLDVICEQIRVLDELGVEASRHGLSTYASFSSPPTSTDSKQEGTS